ncbi:major facilitator superfamily protein [Stylonychia lemnae]|uniref:Major facilitator superfamily protein n=1 Tax=Stylonychia lemnae TaxID=5949 RepID=A0A078B441_STYLE|nr:major facilitator superfamily protein [Stylonychia lemnae]|eukprot:CDW87962.1 major facilitator superfamily protein [Stylonychia lemnae]
MKTDESFFNTDDDDLEIKDPFKTRKILSLIACIICQILVGSISIWGNIQVYVCSFLRLSQLDLEVDDVFIISPTQTFMISIGNIIGTKMLQRFHPRTIVGGLGMGMIFFLPTYVGWKCFPMNKAVVTSVIMCFGGIGTISSALIALMIINPDDRFPDIISLKDDIKYNYYHEDVADNVPIMLRYFALAEFILMILASFFIWMPPYLLDKADEISMPWNVEQSNNEKLKAALKSKSFILSYSMMFTAVLYFQYITIIFKPFGESVGHDDQFLTFVSSIGMIFNCVSRLTGGIILERMNFKKFFGLILVSSVILSFTYVLVARFHHSFALYLAITYFIQGSVQVSMPIYYARIFGPEIGSQAYSYFLTSNSISTLLFSFVVSNFSGALGYSGLLQFTGTSAIVSFILLVFLPNDPIEYKKDCLLDQSSLELGPVLMESYGDFAHASILIRKETLLKRMSTIRKQLTKISREFSNDNYIQMHKKTKSIKREAFGDY